MELLGYSTSINNQTILSLNSNNDQSGPSDRSYKIFESNEGLKVIYTNVDVFNNKKEELDSIIATNDPDLIRMVDLFPKTGNFVFHACEYNIKYNKSYYSNNKNSSYVCKKSLPSSCGIIADMDFEESAWCSIKLKTGDRLLLGCIYRSLNSSEENDSKLLDLLKKIISKAIFTLAGCGRLQL